MKIVVSSNLRVAPNSPTSCFVVEGKEIKTLSSGNHAQDIAFLVAYDLSQLNLAEDEVNWGICRVMLDWHDACKESGYEFPLIEVLEE